MKTWYDVELSDLILPEGGNNEQLIQQMNTIEYLEEIEDLIRLGINKDPIPAREQINNVFVKIYIEMSRLMGNAGKTVPEDIQDYLDREETKKTAAHLLELAMMVDEESWPEVKKQIMEESGIV